MSKIKEYRISILLSIFFFLLGVLTCQVDYEKWSPKNSSDLAAWMQAVGAMVGLAVAIWISGAPNRQEKKNAIVAARYFARTLVESTTGFGCGLQNNKIAVVILTNIALSEMIGSVRNVRSELLPARAMNAFASIRCMAVQVSEMAKLYEARPTEDSKSDFLIFLKHIAGLIDAESRVLHSDVNGVSSEEFSSKDIADRVIRSFEEVKKMAASADSTAAPFASKRD